MGTTILVVEDEVKIRELLRSYFERECFDVVSPGSGADAIGLAQTAAPDLVILDLRLPDVRGESVASEIRRFSGVPVLMLTAKAAEQDRIHGLELGADDYVTKPFSPREVVLRAKAILRRGHSAGAGGGPALFGGGELVIDEERRVAAGESAAPLQTPPRRGGPSCRPRTPRRGCPPHAPPARGRGD